MTKNAFFQILFSILFFNSLPVWAQSKERSGFTPTLKMAGSALLISHYVYHGISQTHSDPALQVQFAYNFGPQIEVGLWGSNVHYTQTDEHLNLQFFASLNIDFSQNTMLRFKYAESKYFHNDRRNGTNYDLHFKMFDNYYVHFENNSNWEGTSSPASHYGFGYQTKFVNSFLFDTQFSYNETSATGYNVYFDVLVQLSYSYSESLQYTLGATFNSESTQFNGDGDPSAFVQIKTLF